MNFDFVGKIWLSSGASKICGYNCTGLNYSFFLESLNYVKFMEFEFVVNKAVN